MTLDVLYALVAFAFATSVTPGPNNLMLMASGANFGFQRSIPHMLGVSLGFAVMIFLIGLGLEGAIRAAPRAELALKIASVLYMLWLAWKIAHSAPPREGVAGGVPMTFLQASAFQWLNPKAWAMALSSISLFAADRTLPSLMIVAGVFGAINLPSVSVWVMAGTKLRLVLTNPVRLAVFNWGMAALLVASLVFVIHPF